MTPKTDQQSSSPQAQARGLANTIKNFQAREAHRVQILEAELQRKSTALRESRENNQILSREVVETQRKRVVQTERLQQAQGELEKLKRTSKVEQDALRNTIRTLQTHQGNTRAEANGLQKKCSTLEERLRRSNITLDELFAKIQALKDKQAALLVHIHHLELV